jgi:hypothetical protein
VPGVSPVRPDRLRGAGWAPRRTRGGVAPGRDAGRARSAHARNPHPESGRRGGGTWASCPRADRDTQPGSVRLPRSSSRGGGGGGGGRGRRGAVESGAWSPSAAPNPSHCVGGRPRLLPPPGERRSHPVPPASCSACDASFSL